MEDKTIAVEDGVEVLYRYKYLPFGGGVPPAQCEGSLKMLTEGTLKFTCPLDFNDPFDCMPAYEPDSYKNFEKYRPDLLPRYGKSQRLSPAERIRQKPVLKKNVENAVKSGEYAKGLASNVGVFCMSRTPCNTLMWSHYANSHKGFVVEFRISMNAPRELVEFILPFKVDYVNERPILNWALSGGENLKQYYLTKSLDWEYEQEERIIIPDRKAGIYPYSREHFLCSVIAGAKMSDSDYEVLRQAIGKASHEAGKTIPLRRARLASHKYKVYVPGHPSSTIGNE